MPHPARCDVSTKLKLRSMEKRFLSKQQCYMASRPHIFRFVPPTNRRTCCCAWPHIHTSVACCEMSSFFFPYCNRRFLPVGSVLKCPSAVVAGSSLRHGIDRICMFQRSEPPAVRTAANSLEYGGDCHSAAGSYYGRGLHCVIQSLPFAAVRKKS